MARAGYPSDKQDQYMVRFPDGMRDRLKGLADVNKRSMNAEIVDRLERTLRDDARAVLADRMREADETGVSEPREPGEPLRYAPEQVDVSDFEREFVEASHQMMLRLMRKHGMNPVDSPDLLPAGEQHATPLDDAEAKPVVGPAKNSKPRVRRLKGPAVAKAPK